MMKFDNLEILEPFKDFTKGDFVHNDEVPEGCIVIDHLKDEFGYELDMKPEIVYAERNGIPLHLTIISPLFKEQNGFGKETRLPCIIFVQGSAFHKQERFVKLNHICRLAAHGYVVAMIECRPSEVAPFPSQMQDCKTAIRFMKKNAEKYQCDVDHFALWGDSSGGHAVLMAGFTGDDAPDTELYCEYSAKVNCIVDWYGPTDFSYMNTVPSSMNHWHPDSPEGYEIGGLNVLENREKVIEASPMNYLDAEKQIPPVLIVHGGRDELVNFDQSCRLYKELKRLNKTVQFIKFDNAGHGFAGFNSQGAIDIIEDFLKMYI